MSYLGIWPTWWANAERGIFELRVRLPERSWSARLAMFDHIRTEQQSRGWFNNPVSAQQRGVYAETPRPQGGPYCIQLPTLGWLLRARWVRRDGARLYVTPKGVRGYKYESRKLLKRLRGLL